MIAVMIAVMIAMMIDDSDDDSVAFRSSVKKGKGRTRWTNERSGDTSSDNDSKTNYRSKPSHIKKSYHQG